MEFHEGQQRVSSSTARFRVVCKGRRWGATTLARHLLIEKASAGQQCLYLAPTEGLARHFWKEMKHELAFLNQPINMHLEEFQWRVVLKNNGGSIEVRYSDSMALHGADKDFAIIDDADHTPGGTWDQVVRPMLMHKHGSAVIFFTPKMQKPNEKDHWTREAYNLGLHPSDDWQSFFFKTSDNPHFSPEELADMRRLMSERDFRNQFEAEFTTVGSVFPDHFPQSPPEPLPMALDLYAIGVDWGHYNGDQTVISVINASKRRQEVLLRYEGANFEVNRARIREAFARWNPVVIVAESNSLGSVNIEALQAEGLPVRPFTTTRRSTQSLIEHLAEALAKRLLVLVDDPLLVEEMKAMRSEQIAGMVQYRIQPGKSDCAIIATALAWYGATLGGVKLDFA